ncbi:hypothetical protein E3E38_03405 [Thermococcus sp. 18S1]|uniref:hypothetical protein n=1 Tax=Thermococcus sp. 18S1 TaxID=1638210 RepID=UPI00143B54F5|nr:hypothetical protein [Thermococcus sp. 18S1]NJE30096.1 hypothetical protein [Thermococcus sp. 18S1]
MQAMELRWNLLAWKKAEYVVSQWEKTGCYLSKEDRESAIRDVKNLLESLDWDTIKASIIIGSTDNLFESLTVWGAYSIYHKKALTEGLLQLSESYCGKKIRVKC